MEEIKEGKVMSIHPAKEVCGCENTDNKRSNKLTYEQLENVAHQLSEQVKWSKVKLEELYNITSSKRLDYLFQVLKYKELFKNGFLEKVISEIEESLTIPEEDQEPVFNGNE